MAILELKNVSLAFGGPSVLDGVDLRVEKGERICLLGRNGEGKTTLLRLLAGEQQPDSGEIHLAAELRVGVLQQEVPGDLAGTVRDVVTGGLAAAAVGGAEWESAHLVDQALSRAGLDGDAAFATLSLGNRRRTLLARALVAEPDILLLDEPTNHLDIDAIDWLEEQLRRFTGTLFFVTHDRAFLRSLAQRILELDRGRLRDWSCDYETFLRRREDDLQNETARRAQFDRKLAEEEVWIRQGVRDRRTRNEGRVRELKKMRAERAERRLVTGDAKIRPQDVERSGKLVLRARGVSFAWTDKPVVADFDTMILRGDKVGVLGPNGAGKTTLLRLLLGDLAPSSGTIDRGTNLQVAYFDQQRAGLDESATVLENVCESGDQVRFNGRALHGITYLQNFLFEPDRARSPLSHLSGGERNRLLLARLFTRPANLLVLDEPTNDLDLETLELLEELLVEFDGTLLLVSHDREFLDNVATSTLVLEGDGRIVETVGGYSDWARASLAEREKRKPAKKSERKGGAGGKPAAGSAPRRLTWKEQQELAALPARIEELESEQASVREQLGDPRLYQEDGDQVGSLKSRLDELESELQTAYARWEELESVD